MGRPLLMCGPLKGILDRLWKGFDETKHPRHPKGSSEGGKFMPKGGGKGDAGKDTPESDGGSAADSRAGKEIRVAGDAPGGSNSGWASHMARPVSQLFDDPPALGGDSTVEALRLLQNHREGVQHAHGQTDTVLDAIIERLQMDGDSETVAALAGARNAMADAIGAYTKAALQAANLLARRGQSPLTQAMMDAAKKPQES